MPRFEGKPLESFESQPRFAGKPIEEAEPEQPKPQDSHALNMDREVLQGMTLGFSDEIGAGMAALAASMTTDATFKDAYKDIVSHVRQEQNAFREQHPVSSTVGQVVGGALTGKGAGLDKLGAKAGAKAASRLAANAKGGAVVGGLAGAGFADEDKIEGAAMGAATGALGGAVAGELGHKLSQKLTQRAEARELVRNGVLSDERTAFMIKDKSGKWVNDVLAREAVDGGIPKPVVAMVKSGSAKDRAAIKEMVSIKRKALTDRVFASKNNPNQVMGRSLAERINYANSVKDQAKKEIAAAADGLKKESVDFKSAVDGFLSELEDAGINFDPSGRFDPRQVDEIFAGSDFEGLEGPMNILTRMIKRMYNSGKVPNAYDVHRLKKFIDNNVHYSGQTEGTAKSHAEKIITTLRHNIDAALDGRFPQYDAANTKYMMATRTIKALEEGLGKKLDMSASNVNRLLGGKGRGLLSNAPYGKKLENAIAMTDDLAEDYGKRFSDDLHLQASFASSLEEMFGTTQKTSIQGVGENVARAAGGDGFAGMEVLKKVKDKVATNDPDFMLEMLEKIADR